MKKLLESDGIQHALLLLPGCILYGVFNLVPLLGIPVFSLHEWSGIGDMNFVGFANYEKLLTEPWFRDQLVNALGQNVLFFAVVIISFLVFGTGLALLLSMILRGRSGFQLIFSFPIHWLEPRLRISLT